MRYPYKHFLGVVSLSTLVAVSCFAYQPARPAHARASLLSNASTVSAGTPFLLAVAFDIDADWHLYWKDPGDSGMPPSVKWTLPEGFTAGELQFPKPTILKTTAGVNYVHEKQLALLVSITPPANLKPGEKLELKGEVTWLECDAEVCLPAKQSVSVSVTTGDRPVPAEEERFFLWQTLVKAGEGFDPKKSE